MRILSWSFKGRIGRGGYVAFVVFAYVAGFLFDPPMRIAMRSLDAEFPPGDLPQSWRSIVWPHDIALGVSIVGWVFLIWIVVAMIAVSARRLHDINLSGWFLLLWVALAFVLPDHSVPHATILTIRDIAWLAITTMVPGTRGPNTYGPDPSDPTPPPPPEPSGTLPA